MKFKTKIVEERFDFLHPKLKEIAEEMGGWLITHGEELLITCAFSTLAEDKACGRLHAGHRSGRAFDFRTKSIPEDILDKMSEHFEEEYRAVAATSMETGKTNLIQIHGNGENIHGHVQLATKYALPPLTEPEATPVEGEKE